MKICPNCGAELDDSVQVCANCGAALPLPQDNQYYSDPNAQQGYYTDPNAQQGYYADPNAQQGYYADPNAQQGYYADTNAQQGYYADTNAQQGYYADPNAQQGYYADPNAQQGYYADPNAQQGYYADPNAQQGYYADPNAQQGYYASNDTTVLQNGYYPTPDMTQQPASKAKKSKKKVIIPIIIALLAVIGVGGYFLRGALMQLVLPADKYIQQNLKSDVKKYSEVISEAVGTTVHSENGTQISTDFGLKLEDNAVDFIDSTAKDLGLDGVFPSDIFKKLDSLNVIFNVLSDGKAVKADAKLTFNDKDMLSGNAILDSDSKNVFFSVPELCDKYGYADASEMFSEETENIANDIKNIVPDEETINGILTRYGDIVAESITNVEKGKTTIEAGGVSAKVTAYKITYTQDEAKAMLVKIIDTMKTDADIKTICENIEKSSTFEVKDCYNELIKALDEAKKELEESKSESDSNLIITLYYSAFGRNEGVTLEFSDSSDEEFGILMPNNGEKLGFKAYLKNGSEATDEVSVEGAGTYKKGVVNLDLVTNDGESKQFKITVINFESSEDKNSGEIKLSLTDEFLNDVVADEDETVTELFKDAAIGIVFDNSIKNKTDNSKIVIYKGKDALLSVSVNTSVKELSSGDKISIPVDADSLDTEKWVSEIQNNDFDSLLKDKLSSAGLTEDDINQIVESFMNIGSIFGGGSASAYDDYDSDFAIEGSENWTDDEWNAYFSEMYS